MRAAKYLGRHLTFHFAVSVLYSLLVWKKGMANGHALSGKILAVYDIIMMLVPYMYWFVVCVL